MPPEVILIMATTLELVGNTSISNCYGPRDTSGISNKTVKARP
jgi:hypothetical protein